MDTFLDLQQLVDERRKHENGRLNVFKTILQQCFSQIKRYNKDKIYELDFKIPLFQIGAPIYDVDALRNYLVHHLMENGLKVFILQDNLTLYISWKETDINLEKYLRKKKTVDQSLFKADGMPVATEVQNTVSPLTMKFRQEKQRQIQQERENRFMNQRSRFAGGGAGGGHLPLNPLANQAAGRSADWNQAAGRSFNGQLY